jgi:hypothetical protein
MKTVWVYVDSSFDVGHPDHLRVFASKDSAVGWLKEIDPEGVVFEYDVLGADPDIDAAPNRGGFCLSGSL